MKNEHYEDIYSLQGGVSLTSPKQHMTNYVNYDHEDSHVEITHNFQCPMGDDIHSEESLEMLGAIHVDELSELRDGFVNAGEAE